MDFSLWLLGNGYRELSLEKRLEDLENQNVFFREFNEDFIFPEDFDPTSIGHTVDRIRVLEDEFDIPYEFGDKKDREFCLSDSVERIVGKIISDSKMFRYVLDTMKRLDIPLIDKLPVHVSSKDEFKKLYGELRVLGIPGKKCGEFPCYYLVLPGKDYVLQPYILSLMGREVLSGNNHNR